MGKICGSRVRYGFTETQRDGCGGNVIRTTYREILTTSSYEGEITGITGASSCAYWDQSLSFLLSSIRLIDKNGASFEAQGQEVLQNVSFKNGATVTGFLSGFSIVNIIRGDCRCTPDSCRVDCASAPDGFCCIDNSFTDRLLQIIKN